MPDAIEESGRPEARPQQSSQPVKPAKSFNKILCNVLINDMQGLLKKYGLTIKNCGVEPYDFYVLVKLYSLEILTKKELREILERRLKSVKEAYDQGSPCP